MGHCTEGIKEAALRSLYVHQFLYREFDVIAFSVFRSRMRCIPDEVVVVYEHSLNFCVISV